MSPTKEDMILSELRRISDRLEKNSDNGCPFGKVSRVRIEDHDRQLELLADRPGRWLGYVATSASIIAIAVSLWGAKRDADAERNQWHKQAATEAHP